MHKKELLHSPLGKVNTYIANYQPDLLFPIERAATRKELGIDLVNLPFQGEDIWNAFEISWLNNKGKPMVATGEFIIPCSSPRLIESKSFKLYLNSLNNSQFDSLKAVETTLGNDLSHACGTKIHVKLSPLSQNAKLTTTFTGTCLDDLDIVCENYSIQPATLKIEDEIVNETVYSDLLKSNCPVTGQPDWASVQITYMGRKIQHEGLLQYIVSFRDHDGFHEDCVERIFTDICKHCHPQRLLVFARYTRRGGLDINPYRANYPLKLPNERLYRQ